MIATVDETTILEELRIPGTSTVRLLGNGALVLEVGGDLEDRNQARITDMRGAEPLSLPLGEYGRLADVAVDAGRIAFFDDPAEFRPATLVIVDLADGGRDTIDNVPTLLRGSAYLGGSVALLGADVTVCLSDVGESGRGTLHVRRSGEDLLTVHDVGNFHAANGPPRVYYTGLSPNAEGPLHGGRVETFLVPGRR